MLIKLPNLEEEEFVSPFIEEPPPHLKKEADSCEHHSRNISGEDIQENGRLSIKQKWRRLESKAPENNRLDGKEKKKNKLNKGSRSNPLRIRSILTEEYNPIVSVIFQGLYIF